MPALLAALLALALTTPSEAAPRRKPHPTCVEVRDPGVGPYLICARPVRR